MVAIGRRKFLGGGAALAVTGTRAVAAEAVTFDALGRRLVDAINDPAADEASLRAVLTERSFRRPVADWLAQLKRLREASGGLDYLGVTRTPREVLVTATARRTGKEVRLTDFSRPETPERFSGFVALPRPAAYPHTLPAGPMERAALVRAIAHRVGWSAERDEVSGAVRVTAPDGAVVFERAWGTSEGTPLTPAHRFHLGSADKSFTALLVARSVEAGRLRYSDRLVDLLPDYPRVEGAEAMTVEHLLSHRAGLGGLFERKGWSKDRRYDRVGELLPVFAGEPLHFTPGSRADYSNEGFVVLGAILEAVNGRSYWNQLADGIYAPARMTRSGHFTAAEAIPDRAIGRRYPDEDELGVGERVSAKDFTGWRGNSCGGGYATVADMTGYLRALRAGRLASATSVARLTTPYAGGLPEYGMGFQLRNLRGRAIVGHSGGGPHSGIDGASFIVWQTGWACSVLGNYDAPFAGPIADDILDMLAAQT